MPIYHRLAGGLCFQIGAYLRRFLGLDMSHCHRRPARFFLLPDGAATKIGDDIWLKKDD